MPSESISEYIIAEHAAFEMERRDISQAIVHQILVNPEQRLSVREGREVFQSRIPIQGKTHLIRVFVDVYRTPPEVVTVYRTSKIDKYWRGSP